MAIGRRIKMAKSGFIWRSGMNYYIKLLYCSEKNKISNSKFDQYSFLTKCTKFAKL